jgi:hypothetical protein
MRILPTTTKSGILGIFLPLLVSIFLNQRAYAENISLPYSGRFIEDDGRPVKGPVDILVEFFPTETSDTNLNEPLLFIATPLSDGVFQLDITLPTDVVQGIFSDPRNPLWIQIIDMTSNKVFPRQKLGAVPFALKVPVDRSTLGWNSKGELEVKADVSANKISGQSVDAAAASNGQVLTWDTVKKTWKAADIAPGSAIKIQGVDISATVPAQGQVLSYVGTQWVPISTPQGDVKNGGQAGALTVGTSNATALTLNANNLAAATILPSGNIGIGNTLPGEKLDITGNIITSGQISNGAQTIVGGTVAVDWNAGNAISTD